jgi:CBS domain containing-hemolysin-like protein
MVLLAVYFLIALLFSFLCSMIESVILSITPSYITKKRQQNKDYAIWLQKYKDNIDRPLAAILTLNTFAHTIGAAGVGAQAQLIWGDESLTVVSIILTLLILIFSEIIPKTIGANYWMSLTKFTVYTLRFLMVILYPFVLFSQNLTKLFNINRRKSVLSRADFSALAELAENEGVFEERESAIIKNIAKFHLLKTHDIMTPRTVVYGLSENTTANAYYKAYSENMFSRIPIFRDSLDNIDGFVLKDELLAAILEGQGDQPIKEFIRPIVTVYKNLPIPQLYSKFIRRKEHIAQVVDEYGGTAGIVTLEDVIETILGLEIIDETDNAEDLQKLARQNWEIRARKMGLHIPDDNG